MYRRWWEHHLNLQNGNTIFAHRRSWWQAECGGAIASELETETPSSLTEGAGGGTGGGGAIASELETEMYHLRSQKELMAVLLLFLEV